MADTRQIVSWSLERPCLFRAGDNWFLPGPSFAQLSDLQTVAEAHAKNRILDGICVTGVRLDTIDFDENGILKVDDSRSIPCSGFRIDERLKKYGGLDQALSVCRQCEANVAGECVAGVAGCYGSLDIWPDSTELDEQLWRIIENRGLEERLRTSFPVTTPLWYGFWINSPLRRPQAELLDELLEPTCVLDARDNGLSSFLNALRAALQWELPLHVRLAPLGHTDFGWYTIFPHCPRCKANAPVGRWQEQYSTDPFECQVCGQVFIPNDHHSREQDEMDFEATSLEKILGKQLYEDFCKRFLILQGSSEQQALKVIDEQNDGPLLRRIAEVRQRRSTTISAIRGKQRSNQRSEKLRQTITFALSDDIDLELILVPAGDFLMGSIEQEHEDELPQHLVRVERPFYIGRYLITQAQWRAVMGNNSSRHKGDWLPVDQVSWFDCQEFCEILCKRQKRVFRLPAEAEWEYACRAGATTQFSFGDTLSANQANFVPMADYLSTSFPRTKRTTTEVGNYPPNAWGIYDMHGNVSEWCEDVWHQNYNGAPADGSAWLDGEDKTAFRVVRGGWYSATENVCRSAARQQLRADAGSADEDDNAEIEPTSDGLLESLLGDFFTLQGFRVVCECDH